MQKQSNKKPSLARHYIHQFSSPRLDTKSFKSKPSVWNVANKERKSHQRSAKTKLEMTGKAKRAHPILAAFETGSDRERGD